jgi:hypothetical protein
VKSYWSLCVKSLPLSEIFLLTYGIVQIVWYFFLFILLIESYTSIIHIDLWNCSDSVVFFLVHFTNPIIYLHYTFLNNVSLSDLTFIQKPFDMHHICRHYFHYPFQDYMLSLYNSCWKTPLQILIQINTSLQQLS